MREERVGWGRERGGGGSGSGVRREGMGEGVGGGREWEVGKERRNG